MKPDLTTLNISINGTRLNRIGNDSNEKSSKCLGIHIVECLTWKNHINHIFRKVSIFPKASEAFVALSLSANNILCIGTFPFYVRHNSLGKFKFKIIIYIAKTGDSANK